MRYFVRFFLASLTASVYERSDARFVQQSRVDPVLDTPEGLSASLSREFGVWREVVEKVGLKRA